VGIGTCPSPASSEPLAMRAGAQRSSYRDSGKCVVAAGSPVVALARWSGSLGLRNVTA